MIPFLDILTNDAENTRLWLQLCREQTVEYCLTASSSKKGVILTLKVESLTELKFDPRFQVIGEYLSKIDSILRYYWHSISIQFDSNILQLLGIPGRLFVPALTQLFRSKWLNFFLSVFSVDTACVLIVVGWVGRHTEPHYQLCAVARIRVAWPSSLRGRWVGGLGWGGWGAWGGGAWGQYCSCRSVVCQEESKEVVRYCSSMHYAIGHFNWDLFPKILPGYF